MTDGPGTKIADSAASGNRPGRTDIWRRAILALLLALTALAYWPGLQGAFLLDDIPNLEPLASFPAAPGWTDYWLFASEGMAGRRYLSYFSFALQHAAWPAAPEAFKLVNLALHLATGLAAYLVCRRLGRLFGETGSVWALLAAAFWLLHPMQVSTVLYVVQRMSILSALLVLLGFLAYLQGREMIGSSRRQGWAWIGGGFLLAMGLGYGAKENALLFPAYLLLFELVLKGAASAGPLRPLPGRMLAGLGLAGGAALLACAALFGRVLMAHYEARDFTPGQRMLSELGVVADYLRAILLPHPGRFSLFHDDYAVAAGWLEPPWTLLALGLHLALLGLAWHWRRGLPLFSFGIGFYYIGHAMESTLLPLELYFEHRNYLPLLGLALAGVTGARRLAGGYRRAAAMLALLWLAVLAAICLGETRLWGDPPRQALVWAREHPHSLRAQDRLVSAYAEAGQYTKAAATVREIVASWPRYPAAYFLWWRLVCQDDEVTEPAPEAVLRAMTVADFSPAPVSALTRLAMDIEEGRCRRMSANGLRQAVSALAANPRYARAGPQLHGLLGRIALAYGDVERARESWLLSYRLRPAPETALLLAWTGLASGRIEEARMLIAQARQLPGAGLRRRQFEAIELQLGNVPEARGGD